MVLKLHIYGSKKLVKLWEYFIHMTKKTIQAGEFHCSVYCVLLVG